MCKLPLSFLPTNVICCPTSLYSHPRPFHDWANTMYWPPQLKILPGALVMCTTHKQYVVPRGNECIPLLLNEDWHHCCSRHLFVFGHCIDLQQMNEWRCLVGETTAVQIYFQRAGSNATLITTAHQMWIPLHLLPLPIALGGSCPCCCCVMLVDVGLNKIDLTYWFCFDLQPNCCIMQIEEKRLVAWKSLFFSNSHLFAYWMIAIVCLYLQQAGVNLFVFQALELQTGGCCATRFYGLVKN